MQPEADAAIVDALYRGVCDPAELQRAAERIALAFDSPSLLLGDLDKHRPDKSALIGVGMMEVAQIERYKSLAHIDYATPVLSRLTPNTAGLTHRLIDPAQVEGLEFHQAFVRPLAISHALGSPLHLSSSRLAMVALHQVEGRPLFDDEDVLRLQRLTPHVARVLHARRAFLALASREATYAGIVEASATGLVGIDRDGTVLFVNAAMRALAAPGDGLVLDRRGLPVPADRGAALAMARLQADVAAGGAGGYLRIQRPSGRLPFVMSVSRLPVHDEALAPGGTLLAVVDPTRRRIPPAARIAAVLGLAPGPARIVHALLAGEDLKLYAERAGLSLNTVRSHLKVAFALTGTHSQADLVRFAMTVLGDLP